MRSILPLLAFVTLLGASSPEAPAPPTAPAPADTLRLAVPSGEVLVTALPGGSDWTYRALRAPALSWLVDRSFFWQTLPAERGREFVLIERQRPGGTADTLVLTVDVGTE